MKASDLTEVLLNYSLCNLFLSPEKQLSEKFHRFMLFQHLKCIERCMPISKTGEQVYMMNGYSRWNMISVFGTVISG